MRFFNRLKQELFYGGMTKEEFHQIKDQVDERNREFAVKDSVVSSFFWFISLFVYSAPEYAQCKAVFFTGFVINLITLLSALFLVKRFSWLLLPTMLLILITWFGVGIGLSVVQPDKRIATSIVIAILIPFVFLSPTATSIAVEMSAIIANIVFGKNIIEPEIFSWGLETMIIYSSAGLIIAHIVNKERFERYVYANSLKKLTDIQKNYNKELKKEVAAKTKRITDLHDKLIIGMATMVESRDNSTGGHIKRTSEVVRILTEEIMKDNSLQLTNEFCEDLIKAAPLHDLGKIAISDEILRKPGRFTPEEYQKMKYHAVEGARVVHEILVDSDDKEYSRIAENVAHYHHERIDGSGYPNSLKGDEIPLEARIMAIADVYDALVSKRVYKEKYSFEDANQIILEGMGTQFDSRLKKYYLAARPKLEAYYSKG